MDPVIGRRTPPSADPPLRADPAADCSGSAVFVECSVESAAATPTGPAAMTVHNPKTAPTEVRRLAVFAVRMGVP